MQVRPFQATDFDALLAINAAGVPGVSTETAETLAGIFSLAVVLVAEDAKGQAVGFASFVELGTAAYRSPNLRWFEAWSERMHTSNLIYVDRIAVKPGAKGNGIGHALYQAGFEAFEDRSAVGCEINIAPANPASEAFHRRLGFTPVGEQTFEPGKRVGYWVKVLHTRSEVVHVL